MIYVSNKKPRLYLNPPRHYMSIFYPSSWQATDYFIMSVDEYMAKKEFNTFDLNMNDIPRSEWALVSNIINNKPLHITPTQTEHPHAYRVAQLIKNAGGDNMWAFDGIKKDLSGYCRQMVVLGGNSLVRWNWVDRNIRYPMYRFAARVLNSLRGRVVKKEWAEWNNMVEDKSVFVSK